MLVLVVEGGLVRVMARQPLINFFFGFCTLDMGGGGVGGLAPQNYIFFV